MKNHIRISALCLLTTLSFAGPVAFAETRSPDDCVGAVSDDSTFAGDKDDAAALCKEHTYDQIICGMGLSSDKNFIAKLKPEQIQPQIAGVLPAALAACAKDSTTLGTDVEASAEIQTDSVPQQ